MIPSKRVLQDIRKMSYPQGGLAEYEKNSYPQKRPAGYEKNVIYSKRPTGYEKNVISSRGSWRISEKCYILEEGVPDMENVMSSGRACRI